MQNPKASYETGHACYSTSLWSQLTKNMAPITITISSNNKRCIKQVNNNITTPLASIWDILRTRPYSLCLVHSAMAVTERPPSYSSSAPQSNASPSTGESAPIYQDSEGFFTTRNGVSFLSSKYNQGGVAMLLFTCLMQRLLLLLIVIVIGAMFLVSWDQSEVL